MLFEEAISVLRKEVIGDGGLMFKLEVGKGFDDHGFDRVVKSLNIVAQEWEHKSEVPKAAVALIFWLDKAIESCSYGYSEEKGDYIRQKAMQVHDLLELIFGGS